MDILDRFGVTIRALRKERGLTQEELGEKAGLHLSYIGGVERGERNLSLESINKICNALEMSITDVFTIMEKPSEIKEEFLSYLVNVSPRDVDFFQNLIDYLIKWRDSKI